MMHYRLVPTRLPNAFGSYGAISLFWTQSTKLRLRGEELLGGLGPPPRVPSFLSPMGPQGLQSPTSLTPWKSPLHAGYRMLLIRCGSWPHPFSVLGLPSRLSPTLSFSPQTAEIPLDFKPSFHRRRQAGWSQRPSEISISSGAPLWWTTWPERRKEAEPLRGEAASGAEGFAAWDKGSGLQQTDP